MRRPSVEKKRERESLFVIFFFFALALALGAVSPLFAAAKEKAAENEKITAAETDRAPASRVGGIDFGADFYQHVNSNVIKARGNAWVRRGGRIIRGDEIEIDHTLQRAIANGNVHLTDGGLDIWCRHASFNLAGEDAILDDARMVTGKVVVTGVQIRRINSKTFEVEEGSYSNCNVDLLKMREVAECPLDWKLNARRFHITMGEYAHFYDAIIFAKTLPFVYLPYFLLPMKSERETGLLLPRVATHSFLGSGSTLPLFLNLGAWHDLTITPTYWSKTGFQVGLEYRYVYSGTAYGFANAYLLQRRFSPTLNNPGPDDVTRSRALGIVGEGAINVHNIYAFGDRSHSRQMLRLVSNPYFTRDYSDLGALADLGSLRSQIAVTMPSDSWLLTGQLQHYQPLVVSIDTGVDRGAVSQLPSIIAAKTSKPLVSNLLSYEFDAIFNNYTRSTAFDDVPTVLQPNNINIDPVRGYDADDYLRTGQRVQLEPRLIAHVPMPPGFQFQPLLKVGSLLYHFPFPSGQSYHREYVETELPVSIYMSRRFDTGIAGYEKISHVFQPRFIYANSLYQSEPGDHPFFTRPKDPTSIRGPGFDLIDQLTPYEYMRFELINRFRRKTASGVERFFLLQLSEQYNVRTSTLDPRFLNKLGPIEVLSEVSLGRFTLQLQGIYQLELVKQLGGKPLDPFYRESDWSTSLIYNDPGSTVVRLDSVLRQRADRALVSQIASLYFYKTLPTFFDIDGQLEYSMKDGAIVGHALGFHFRGKPRSCWRFSLSTGRDAFKQAFTRFSFQLDFGNPDGITM